MQCVIVEAHCQWRQRASEKVMGLTGHVCFHELSRARQLLGDCHVQAIRLEDAAELIHLSPWHFQREFQRAFGETPHGFLTRLRIEHAKQLLESTDMTVYEVCLEVGFKSLGSFTRLFGRRVGLSPAKYRRAVRSTIAVSGLRQLVRIPFCFAHTMAPSSIRKIG